MAEKERLSGIALDIRRMRRISLAILLVLLVLNCALFLFALNDKEDITASTLYGLNLVSVALLFVAVLLPRLFIARDGPMSGIPGSLLVTVVGTIYACSLVISIALAFGSHFVPGGPIIAITGTLAIVAFVAYVIKVYTEKRTGE